MLQRIQTLYLLIVSMLTALLFVLPFFALPLIVSGLLLSLGNIFLYKNRSLQVKLNYANILVFIAMYGVAFWQMGFDFAIMPMMAVIPMINIILTFLAIQNIKKDEKLVRSLDRLR